MAESFTYKYPRPMVTVDLVVFGIGETGLRTLLIRRKHDPFAGRWAIPGGYLEMDETFADGARRELREETGLDALAVVEEIGAFGAPCRDPRGRTVSIAHAGIARPPLPPVSGGDDASGAEWLDPHTIGPLAFDHADILARALSWLADAADRVLFDLLPDQFTIEELSRALAVRPGRRKPMEQWLSEATAKGTIVEEGGKHRRSPRAEVNNAGSGRPR